MKHRAPVAWRKSLRHDRAETCFSKKLYSSASRHRLGDQGDSFGGSEAQHKVGVAFNEALMQVQALWRRCP